MERSAIAIKLDTTLFVSKKCFSHTCTICAHHGSLKKCNKGCTFFQALLSDTEDGHYKSFDEVLGETTSEKDRPLAIKKAEAASHRFTLKNMKNADMMLQCEECELWRLVYGETKLTKQQKELFEEALADCVFTCGSALEDLQVEGFSNVYTRPLNCYDHVEKQ